MSQRWPSSEGVSAKCQMTVKRRMGLDCSTMLREPRHHSNPLGPTAPANRNVAGSCLGQLLDSMTCHRATCAQPCHELSMRTATGHALLLVHRAIREAGPPWLQPRCGGQRPRECGRRCTNPVPFEPGRHGKPNGTPLSIARPRHVQALSELSLSSLLALSLSLSVTGCLPGWLAVGLSQTSPPRLGCCTAIPRGTQRRG